MAKIRTGKPQPRWGATKAQADRYERERKLKNEIFEKDARIAQLVRLCDELKQASGFELTLLDIQALEDLARTPLEHAVHIGTGLSTASALVALLYRYRAHAAKAAKART